MFSSEMIINVKR